MTSLNSVGGDPKTLDAVFVTHGHTDHTSALSQLMKKWELPVHMSGETAGDLRSHCSYINDTIVEHDREYTVRVGELTVSSFRTPHDSPGSVGYIVSSPDETIGVATDIGYVTQGIFNRLCDCDRVIIESNYDEEMLRTGPYPYPLKRRIDGSGGHLSNEAAAGLLLKICHTGLHQVILGHLSQTNNYPLLALETVRGILNGGPESARQIRLSAAPAQGLSECIEFNTESLSEV